MVHKRRTMDPEAKTPEVQAFLEGLRRRKAFYYTPMGSNDDCGCAPMTSSGDCRVSYFWTETVARGGALQAPSCLLGASQRV
eukprot:791500-Pelagomonas_calceolata.AAC.7